MYARRRTVRVWKGEGRREDGRERCCWSGEALSSTGNIWYFLLRLPIFLGLPSIISIKILDELADLSARLLALHHSSLRLLIQHLEYTQKTLKEAADSYERTTDALVPG
jgi:hypothetical protein